jgi:hypothetical protein
MLSVDKKYYIRFDEIPPNGKSKIYAHGEPIGEEIGVSTYECVPVNGEYRILIPKKPTHNTFDDLHYFLAYFTGNKYLIFGTEMGTGSDGEPLLKDVTIIKKL